MSRTKQKSSSTKKFEPIIVAVVIMGILLPVRLIFSEFVSDDWFSSFGLISAISITMLILVKKNKLGKFGTMFHNQMIKLQHGKKGIMIYGYVLFITIFLSTMIIAVNFGNSEYFDVKEQLLSEMDSQSESIVMNNIKLQDWVSGAFNFLFLLFTGSAEMFALLAILNDIFDGWLLHFYTVGLVESLELLGILLFYRVFLPKTRTQSNDL